MSQILKLKDGRILLVRSDGVIFELNPDGTINKQIWAFPVIPGELNHHNDSFLIQLANGNILGVVAGTIFQVGLDGTFKLSVKNFFDDYSHHFTNGIQLQDGNILLTGIGYKIVHLNEDGSIKTIISLPSDSNIEFANGICQLQDGRILAGTFDEGDGASIYELNNK